MFFFSVLGYSGRAGLGSAKFVPVAPIAVQQLTIYMYCTCVLTATCKKNCVQQDTLPTRGSLQPAPGRTRTRATRTKNHQHLNAQNKRDKHGNPAAAPRYAKKKGHQKKIICATTWSRSLKIPPSVFRIYHKYSKVQIATCSIHGVT